MSNEFNLLNDFLQSSMLDDGLLQDEHGASSPQTGSRIVYIWLPERRERNFRRSPPPGALSGPMLPPSVDPAKAIPRPASVPPIDKAREYYLQAADPSGNDTPEERMQRVLKAKYDAGLLKPFNYVKGYARLSAYLDTHVAASSKQKIIRQIDPLPAKVSREDGRS